MRLLNTADRTTLRESLGHDAAPYAILSHCWAHEPGEEEVSYQQLVSGTYDAESQGWLKIANCCWIAESQGLEWAWIDTCCIDKTSSSELSETINSMFAWYGRAQVCYVFLHNFHASSLPKVDYMDSEGRWKQGLTSEDIESLADFVNNRWFHRG